MNSKKAKRLRAMDAEVQRAAAQAVTCLYEVTVKIYSNGKTSVTTNKPEALNDPILFLSIMSDANKAVLHQWHENRERAKQIVAENKSPIITL